jgi:hypothetical protein
VFVVLDCGFVHYGAIYLRLPMLRLIRPRYNMDCLQGASAKNGAANSVNSSLTTTNIPQELKPLSVVGKRSPRLKPSGT